MESWLPWLTADEHLLLDLLPANALVLLVEPRRMRDRAAELLDEEAALAATLAQTWGAAGRGLPPPPPALRPAAGPHRRRRPDGDRGPRGPGHRPWWPPPAGTRWSATASGLIGQLRDLRGRGLPVVVCAEGRGSGARLAALLGEHGLPRPVPRRRARRPR